MIQLQIIGKDGAKLQPLIRTAIQEGQIRAFQVAQVKGGLKIQHTKYEVSRLNKIFPKGEYPVCNAKMQ